MEKITVRELKAKPSHYLKMMRCGSNVIINGFEYAYIGKNVDEVVDHGVKKEKKVVKTAVVRESSVDPIELDSEWFDEDGVRKDGCEKCGGVGYWAMWEDGEEHIVCDLCVRRSCSEKMYKGVVKGYRKI